MSGMGITRSSMRRSVRTGGGEDDMISLWNY